jgi:hypothetical protein
VPHQLACPPLGSIDRLLLIALRALHRLRSVRLTGSSSSRCALCIVSARFD